MTKLDPQRGWTKGAVLVTAMALGGVVGVDAIVTPRDASMFGPRVAEAQSPQARRISFDDARRIALEQVPNARATSVELKERSRPVMYEVELEDASGREYEVWIDAATGAVLRVEQD